MTPHAPLRRAPAPCPRLARPPRRRRRRRAAAPARQDLSELLLPTPVLPALLARFGVRCDAESYYLSSVYTRNPADYRPDCVAVQCNLEAL